MKILSLLTGLFLFFNINAFSQTLIVDSSMYLSNAGYDTIIVKNGATLTIGVQGSFTWKNMVQVYEYFKLEAGAKVLGDADKGYLALQNAWFINNSGKDSVVNMNFNHIGGDIYVGGNYPTEITDFMCGWGGRDVYLDTTFIINGMIFDGFTNVIFMQGNDLILGKNAYFNKLQDGQVAFVTGHGGRIIKKIDKGITYQIPFAEDCYGFQQRADVTFEVDENATLGSNPQVALKLIADSIPVAAEGDAASAVKRFMKIEYTDITNPDLDITMALAPSGADYSGNHSVLYSAFYNGTSWKYQPFDDAVEIIQWNELNEEGILTAGRNLGLDTALCYPPQKIYMKSVGNNSANVIFNNISDTINYLISYKEKSAGTWTQITSDTNYSEITSLQPSTKYNLKVASLCSNGADTSDFSNAILFSTSLVGYLPAYNKLVINNLDTISPSVLYDTIIVNPGGTGVFTDNITVKNYFNVDSGGTLKINNYALYGDADFIAEDYSNLKYSKMFIKNSQNKKDAVLRNSGMQYIKGDVNITLTGNLSGINGQRLDDNFPNSVNDLIIESVHVGNFKSSGLTINGSLIFNNGKYRGYSMGYPINYDGDIYFKGDSLISNCDSAFFNGKIIIFNDAVISGTHPMEIKDLELGNNDDTTSLLLSQNLNIKEVFKLDPGIIKLNNHNLSIKSIDKSNGSLIGETGGSVTYRLDNYDQIKLPFTDTSAVKDYTLNFNLSQGNIGNDAQVTFKMVDSIPPELGNAPVDYLTRYADIQINDITSPVFNLSFYYDSLDVTGTESFMENSIYHNGQWYASSQQLDSVNHKLAWEGIDKTGIITAGNFLGFDTAQAINLQAKEVTTSAATFSWEYPDEGVDNWSIFYKPTSSGTFSNETGITNLQKRIYGLSSGTEYEWYITSSQNGGYPEGIGLSVRDTFSTGTGCDQPVELTITNIDTNEIALEWNEGEAPYTIQFKKKDSTSWVSLSPLSDDSSGISSLEQQSAYYVRVKSNCGAVSDSMLTNTLVPGWNEEKNILEITTERDIPTDFQFDKIIVKNSGIATVTSDLSVKDSLIVEPGGHIICDTCLISGFAFVLKDSAFLFSSHPHCISNAEDAINYTKGNIQTIVRDYGREARYTFNGKQPQQMHAFFSSDGNNKGQNDYYYLTIDNPTEVKAPAHNINIRRKLTLSDGVFALDPYKNTINIKNEASLVNNAGEQALNYHKCYLQLSGGDDLKDNGAFLEGSATTFVDSVYCGGNDEPYITGTLKIAHKIKTRDRDWYDGYIIDGGKIIIDTGCVVFLPARGHRFITRNGGTLQVNYNNNLLDSTITIKIGRKSGYMPIEYTMNSSSNLSDSAAVAFEALVNAFPGLNSANNFLNAYWLINSTGIDSVNYNMVAKYNDKDIAGENSNDTLFKPAAYLNQYGFRKYDSVDYSNNQLFYQDLSGWGAFFAIDSSYMPPEMAISTHPANAFACIDSSTSINISMNGLGISYQWQVDSGTGFTDITANDTYSNVNLSSLTINNASASMDGYLYRCIVSDLDTTIYSQSASLTVTNIATNIITNPVSQFNINAGSAVSYTVTAEGAGLSYQWLKDSIPLIDTGHITGSATNSLSLSNITLNDAGSYQCIVYGACGNEISSKATLTVTSDIKEQVYKGISIYPNPTKGLLKLISENIQIDKIEMLDITGRPATIIKSVKQPVTTIDISNNITGIYVLRIYTKDEIYSVKIVKE